MSSALQVIARRIGERCVGKTNGSTDEPADERDGEERKGRAGAGAVWRSVSVDNSHNKKTHHDIATGVLRKSNLKHGRRHVRPRPACQLSDDSS